MQDDQGNKLATIAAKVKQLTLQEKQMPEELEVATPFDQRVIITMKRCVLVLTEKEMLEMLKEHPGLWSEALQRGKAYLRHRQALTRTPKLKPEQ